MRELTANPDERRIAIAVMLSLVIHATAVGVVPNLRQRTQTEPEPLHVDLVPLPPPPKPVEPVAALPPEPELVQPEPAVKPEPKLEPKPEPKPKPKIKAVKKKEPPEAPPPREEVAPEPEPPPPAPVIAAPPQPQVIEPPEFKVPAPPPEPAPPIIAEAPSAEIVDGYGKKLSDLVARYKHYPRIAQRRGWEGTVQVAIDIGAQGKISGMKISRSSGYDVLDDQALEMIKTALPFPPAPPSLNGKQFVVNVPIIFRLKN